MSDSCNYIDCSPSGSSARGILQARILEWAAMPSSWDLPNPGIEPMSLASPTLAGGFFTTSATGEARRHYRVMIYYNITDVKRIEFSFDVGTA